MTLMKRLANLVNGYQNPQIVNYRPGRKSKGILTNLNDSRATLLILNRALPKFAARSIKLADSSVLVMMIGINRIRATDLPQLRQGSDITNKSCYLFSLASNSRLAKSKQKC